MKKLVLSVLSVLSLTGFESNAQTNVFDDVIALSPNHTYLEQAILQEGLEVALRNNSASLTVFAPDDQAFSDLANALGTDINGLLANPELTDILLYHVLGSTVSSTAITNGAVEQPLSSSNTLKFTVTSTNSIFVNQSLVDGPNLPADNGLVHSLDEVLLPVETVVDIALDNGFTTLATAVIQEELLPVLTDPLSSLTVFAPTNEAFDNLATALGTDINGLLALENLADVLTYHVLGSEVQAAGIANGQIAQPLSQTNDLKMTVTSGGMVYANQAQVISADNLASNGAVHVIDAVVLPYETVVDIALDNGFTTLATAVIQEELLPVLTDPLSTVTVFAPTNEAFDNLASALGTDINGLLALEDLSDILTYHVLGSEVLAADISNGQLAQPISQTNNLKMTVTSGGMVYANQAQVTSADNMAFNGAVHVLNAVVLPYETVVDIALDNGFTTLATAAIQEELLPVLTDPLSSLTVFAPTNEAFDNLASSLGTDVNGLLALNDLTDILTYHVIGAEVLSADISNGQLAQPLSQTNTLKMTVTSGGMVYANQAQVTSADNMAFNGAVHVLDAVVLPYETVVDVAIDNGFTTLTTAVIQEELLPALTNPLASLTVFAPTNTAFENLATELGTDLNGILANPDLTNILLYHVLGQEVLSSQLSNGDFATLNGQSVTVDITSGVMINDASVAQADLDVFNGVVHAIDKVLLPTAFASIDNLEEDNFEIYPNPVADNLVVNLNSDSSEEIRIVNASGKTVLLERIDGFKTIDLSDLERGSYFVNCNGIVKKLIKL